MRGRNLFLLEGYTKEEKKNMYETGIKYCILFDFILYANRISNLRNSLLSLAPWN